MAGFAEGWRAGGCRDRSSVFRTMPFPTACARARMCVYRFNEEARAEKLMPLRSPESPLLRNGARIVRPSRSLLVTERSGANAPSRAKSNTHPHPSDSGSVIATTIATTSRV